ncbi:hypothetical protein [Streptomyces kaniharaensis]|nr:hypothetical protein [Streptomyces kaniharaensis]
MGLVSKLTAALGGSKTTSTAIGTGCTDWERTGGRGPRKETWL